MRKYLKITTAERQMLYLLRCAMWEQQPDIRQLGDTPDWQAIMEAAGRHTVHGLVAQQVKKVADQTENEPLMKASLKVLMKMSHDNRLVNTIVADLTRVMREDGYHTVLLKGQGVARYYPQPELRCPGDIDYYTGEQTDEIAELLHEKIPDISYHPSSNKPLHINGTLQGVEIELHRRATNLIVMPKANAIHEWTEHELHSDNQRIATISRCEVTVPSAIFDAIHVFHHFYHHFLRNGIGLRHVCDWLRTLYVNRDEIDTVELERLLREFETLEAWQLFGLMAVRHLGMPQEVMPLYDGRRWRKADLLMRELVKDSNFGFEKRGRLREIMSESFLVYKCRSIKHYTRLFWVRSRLFGRQGRMLLISYYRNGIKKLFKATVSNKLDGEYNHNLNSSR